MPEYDALFVGSGVNSLASAALLSRAGWRVCVLERADRLGRRDPHRARPHRARFHARGDVVVAPALRRLGCLCRARRCPGAPRARVPEHRAPDGLALPRRLAPRSCRPRSTRTSPSSSASRAGDGAAWKRQFEEFMGSAELSFGVLSSELWSLQGALARALGLSQARSPRAAGLRRHDARERARLARGDVRIRRRARAARAVGAAHGPRARAGGLRLHDAGDRLRGAARRHAGAAGRRHPARRGARGDRARGRRRSCAPARTSQRILVEGGRATGVELAGGERVLAARAVIASVTPDAAVRAAARARATCRTAIARSAEGFRYGRAGMQIHLALREPPRVGLERGRAARRRPRSCTSPPGSTASRAPSTRPIAGLLPGRGDDRRRPAVRRRPEPGARGQLDHLDPAAGAAAARAAATRSARSTSATAAGRSALRDAYADRILDAARHADHEPRARDAEARRALAGRPRGAELQPRRRRHLRGLVRARPEPPVAPDGRPAGSRDAASTGLWQIGASTHPGPGLGAGSGYLVAKELLPGPKVARITRKLDRIGALAPW